MITSDYGAIALEAGVYWKDLRTQRIEVFVPGRNQILQLSGHASAIWKKIVGHISVLDIKREFPVFKISDDLELEIDAFLDLLHDVGAIQRVTKSLESDYLHP